MVSMKDIAKLCGVSVATVSKALNDYSDVGEATKERIRAVAEEQGYFPNSSARALKTTVPTISAYYLWMRHTAA